jgi:hypothetical protein
VNDQSEGKHKCFFAILKRGKKVPRTLWHPELTSDGAILEQGRDGAWFLFIYCSRITHEEQEVFRKNKIHTRFIQGKNPLSFMFLCQFEGHDELTFELYFDPILYAPDTYFDRKKAFFTHNTVTMICVDNKTGILKALRFMTWAQPLYSTCVRIWENHITAHENASHDNIEKSRLTYKHWQNNLQQQYHIMTLWEMGLDGGVFGEETKGK